MAVASIKSYPYPVLGNSDDVAGIFHVKPHFTLDVETIHIEADIELQNETIEELISSHKAVFVMQVDGSSTTYRRTFNSFENTFDVLINSGDLRDKVEVSFYICAIEQIQEYDPIGTHPELAGDSTRIDAGDIIGYGGLGAFIADKSFDPLKAPVTSLMKIKKASFADGPMAIEYGDQIIIRLSKNDYEKYLQVKSIAASVLHSSIVLAALVETLYEMKNNGSNYTSDPWFVRIQEICRIRGIDFQEPLMAAQKLLGQPVGRGLNQLTVIGRDLIGGNE
jgi:hypothetical protein